jgi:hypothetical protein
MIHERCRRGCLPIIGYFAELQERHEMTQTLERGIKSEHSEAERTRGNERPMMFGLALGDVRKHPID